MVETIEKDFPMLRFVEERMTFEVRPYAGWNRSKAVEWLVKTVRWLASYVCTACTLQSAPCPVAHLHVIMAWSGWFPDRHEYARASCSPAAARHQLWPPSQPCTRATGESIVHAMKFTANF